MKRSIRIILAAAVIIIGAMDAMAIEEATYNVLQKDDKFEIRAYTPHILAETVEGGDLEEAGNNAFNRLFRYISGENHSRQKVSMTVPVSQEAMEGEDHDDGSRWTAACSGKVGGELHDAHLVHLGNPPRAGGSQSHAASGSRPPDGRSTLLRVLE
jgi:hypothetical protein